MPLANANWAIEAQQTPAGFITMTTSVCSSAVRKPLPVICYRSIVTLMEKPGVFKDNRHKNKLRFILQEQLLAFLEVYT